MQWDEKQSRRESSILPTRKWTEKEETFFSMHALDFEFPLLRKEAGKLTIP